MTSFKSVTAGTFIAGMIALACNASIHSQNLADRDHKLDSSLKGKVDLVAVNVVVSDGQGRTVPNLTQGDFRIWEDSVEQNILSVDAEEVPTSIAIIVDFHNSMKRQMGAVRDAAAAFLKNSDKEDEYFLYEFSNRPKVADKFTSDISKLQDLLMTVQIEGADAMYDALYLASERLKVSRHSRKALLLITDGDDYRGQHKRSDIVQFLKETDVQVYPIGILFDELIGDIRGFENIADVSGGRAFFPRSAWDLKRVCERIGNALRTQYVVVYKSTNKNRDGAWRKIQVRLKQPDGSKHVRVWSRSGYYALPK